MLPNQSPHASPIAALCRAVSDVLRQSLRVCRELFTIMIPVVIAVKVLQELGAVPYLAWPLTPLMALCGLPPEMGLVWAAALLNSIYSGIIVFLSLDASHLTQAQVTVLGVLLLVAHNMPVELSIARKSGARLRFQLVARFLGALALGMLLNAGYSWLGVLQGPAHVLLAPQAPGDPSLPAWALGEARKLLSIALVVTALLGLMRLLSALRVIAFLNRMLGPVLKCIGIGPAASSLTVAGLTLGVAYGAGLILHEARSGRVDKRDVFFSMTLMGLCHSLIEDTLLLAMIGGHLSGILWARLLFALLATALLVKAAAGLSPALADRVLWSDLARAPAP